MNKSLRSFWFLLTFQVLTLALTAFFEYQYDSQNGAKRTLIMLGMWVLAFTVNWIACVYVPYRIRHRHSAAIGLYEAAFRFDYYRHASRNVGLLINGYMIGRNTSMYWRDGNTDYLFGVAFAAISLALWIWWSWGAEDAYRKPISWYHI